MGLVDNPVIQRIAELRTTQKLRGKLSSQEQAELDLCLDWLVNKCWSAAYKRNLSLVASMSNDVDWQHEICRDIDEDENDPSLEE